jgi:3-dehydroquinate synthase
MRMKTVRVATEPAYDVRIGRGLLSQVAASTPGAARSAILTDENVARLHRRGLIGLEDVPSFSIAPGEDSKRFAILERVLDFMAERGLDRSACLVLFGGGVVGDLGALAASLYMRGVDFVQVPTTLLAQVDSSVGGKTAVNLRAGKNLAGTFRQPSLVIADTQTLATLSEAEYRSGLGEVVKSALIAGEDLLALLERERAAIMKRDADVLAEVVECCVRTKAAIVERDPNELGERKKLNLGHTFAHAIEHVAGYGRVPHGVAVAVGLTLALETSRDAGVLRDLELPARVERLLTSLGLPSHLKQLRSGGARELEPRALHAAMRVDKKSRGGEPRFVLVESAGRVTVDAAVELTRVERLLAL